jgi:mono/diheme cytochrome c family protein
MPASPRLFLMAVVCTQAALISHTTRSARAQDLEPTLEALAQQFETQVLPLIEQHCNSCHQGPTPEAGLDLSGYQRLTDVTAAHPVWESVLLRIEGEEMPPADAETQWTTAQRKTVVNWIAQLRHLEAERTAGDPGPVLVRRLSNVEFDNCIRDLTGVDIRPTRTFPVDPANASGFDNSGESLTMSPALLNKYLAAAREVAEHMVLTPSGIAFAAHPVVTDTDRDKYCVKRIVEFYERQPTDLADYFYAVWSWQQATTNLTVEQVATQQRLSPRYLRLIRDALQSPAHRLGPWEPLLNRWQALLNASPQAAAVTTEPSEIEPDALRAACAEMRDYVHETRRIFEPKFDNLTAEGIHKGAQPFVLWKNRQYAAHRRTADLSRWEFPENGPDQRSDLEAACRSFCEVFPDAFYISERGRDYLDKPREQQEKGRLLSAGFHSMMGYFRDDRPLMELILDDAQQRELDELWRELDFFTAAPIRQYQGFLWFERTDSRTMRDAEFDFARPEDKAALAEPMIARLSEVYLAKAQNLGAGPTQLTAIADYFRDINTQIRWVESARVAAEPVQLQAVIGFAGRAVRRPLSAAEIDNLQNFYHDLRQVQQLSHDEALQDTLVSILMSPQFCYRLDLLSEHPTPQPLDDYQLASRLSFFLWASQPDEELLNHAQAGDLRHLEVLLAQTQRMLADSRAHGLATEFAANWLDIRRFQEHNSVDRQRFGSFDDQLRSAMFEEPIRFFLDIVQHNRSVLDLLYADRTFLNQALAKHYGITSVTFVGDEWQAVHQVNQFGRGGLLPMAVFLTKNAPGLRTSPVKRGYWVVRHLLGERIPAPPPNVPELPADEAQLGELTLREALARHREHASCAGCHNRIDSIGLVFENYGPIGELRTVDLGGRAVDTMAEFPDGSQRRSVAELREYIRQSRESDFLDNLQKKLLTYALSRSLQLSDQRLLRNMRSALEANEYQFHSLVETIVTSSQFLNLGSSSSPSWAH